MNACLLIALRTTASILLATAIVVASAASCSGAGTRADVTFSGGHEIGKHDFGRPVVLIAAALGVKPDQFREAFSGVTPARGRGPTGDEARRNKAALMRVLAPLGITNERLDEVSDYYRFRPERDELWPTTPAKAYAVVKDGQIKRIVVTRPGAGYSSPPAVKVAGFSNQKFEVTLHFDKRFKRNGSIAAVKPAPAQPAAKPQP